MDPKRIEFLKRLQGEIPDGMKYHSLTVSGWFLLMMFLAFLEVPFHSSIDNNDFINHF